MKVGERDAQILQAIQRHCDEIAETIRLFGDSKDVFLESYVYRNACAMPLQTIGELAKRLTDAFLTASGEQHGRIDWKSTKSMRNFFAHEYSNGVNFDIVWDTIKKDVPALRGFCAAILKENGYELIRVKSLR